MRSLRVNPTTQATFHAGGYLQTEITLRGLAIVDLAMPSRIHIVAKRISHIFFIFCPLSPLLVAFSASIASRWAAYTYLSCPSTDVRSHA